MQLGDEELLLCRISRPGGGGQAEGCVVSDLYGFVDVVNTEEHGDRTEELFAVDLGGAGNVGEDCGFEIVALAYHALAAGQHACTARVSPP